MIYIATPFDLMTYTIQLRYPTIERKLQLNSIFQTAMDGSVASYLVGGTDSILELEFSELSRQEAMDFLTFLQHAAGKTVRLEIDDNVWKGQFLSVPVDMTTVARGRGGTEFYSEANGIKLQFRGEIQ